MSSQPKVNTIYSELRQLIVDRTIPPRTKLSEASLSRKWRVSRTPIREVLKRLESEDLITYSPYKGFIVKPITIEDIDKLYIIRIVLEGLAGKLATPVISGDPKKLEILEKLCKGMEALSKKGELEAYIAKNSEFHSYIWQNCGNEWLIKILRNLDSQVSRFMVKSLHVPLRMGRSVDEHWEIYKEMKSGNAKGVEKAIQSNHKKASENLKRELLSRT